MQLTEDVPTAGWAVMAILAQSDAVGIGLGLDARRAGPSRDSDVRADRVERNTTHVDFSASIAINNSGAPEEAVNALTSALRDNSAQ